MTVDLKVIQGGVVDASERLAYDLRFIYKNHDAAQKLPEHLEFLNSLDEIWVNEDESFERIAKHARTYNSVALHHRSDYDSARKYSKNIAFEEFALGMGGVAFGLPLQQCLGHFVTGTRLAIMSEEKRVSVYMNTPFSKTERGHKEFVKLRETVEEILAEYEVGLSFL